MKVKRILIEAFLRNISLFLPTFLIFFSGLLALSLTQEGPVEVYDLRSYTHPTYTRIVVDIGKLREYTSAELKDPDRIFVDIYQARLNPILHGKTVTTKCDYLKEIRIAQKNEMTVRVVAEINPARVERYQVFPLFDPFRIVIDVYPKKTAAAPPATAPVSPLQPGQKPAQAAEPTPQGYSMARQLGLGVKTIVIDPGHGGEDPGAISHKGQREKDVALDVALELRDLLAAEKGLNVILTRESDIYIPLENRTVIANQSRADIFISIHANSNRKKNYRGVETFFLNFSPDAQVVEVAARENATSSKTIGEMEETLKKIVQNSKILESRDLADKIQGNLVKSLSQHYSAVEDLGVRGGPFWVLIGGEMPSVLVEVSHLSNPQEEERLRSTPYRRQIALGIYQGILEYMRSLGKG
jgi:N-acetylmuramoyl-L-alanine amidase